MDALLLLVTFASGGEAAATYSSLQDDTDDARAHDVCDDSIARQRLTAKFLVPTIRNIECRLAEFAVL